MAFDFEEAFKEYYGQPFIVPIPDDLDPELPRIVLESQKGHSQISITQINLSLNVLYSDDWQTDHTKGCQYILDRCNILFDVLNRIKELKPNFCGLKTMARISTDFKSAEIISRLASVINFDINDSDLHDVVVKFTHKIEDKYYNNIVYQNYRQYKQRDSADGIFKLPDSSALEEGIQINIDFNDRLAFNEVENYQTDVFAAKLIVEKGFEYLNSEIRRFRELNNAENAK